MECNTSWMALLGTLVVWGVCLPTQAQPTSQKADEATGPQAQGPEPSETSEASPPGGEGESTPSQKTRTAASEPSQPEARGTDADPASGEQVEAVSPKANTGPATATPPPPPKPTRAALPAAPSRKVSLGDVQVAPAGGATAIVYLEDAGAWRELCVSPCWIDAPRGPARYGLSAVSPSQRRTRVRDAGHLWVTPGDGIETKLRDRTWVRFTGRGLAVLAGSGLAVAAALGPEKPQVVFPVLSSAVVAAVVMALMPDRARVRRCIGCGKPR